MSLGAEMAGIDVKLAVEKDHHAAATYAHNYPNTRLYIGDIANIDEKCLPKKENNTILFGGPPCQGFSTSNQRTRGSKNHSNWLFQEYIRIVRLWQPDWVVFENVKGIIETEKGIFVERIQNDLADSGYTTTHGVLCASDFGVPQVRSRFFLIGSSHGFNVDFPKPLMKDPVTVKEAISDLPKLDNGANYDFLPYPCKPRFQYARNMRNGDIGCSNHNVTRNAAYVIERYNHIPQGGNWEDIPESLMANYSDRKRCHTGIYHRLDADKPSVVIGNFRKNMLIHPTQDRGLSLREAARLQSFPDWYEFMGSIGFQQQQVGNAVPPLLAMSVFFILTRN